MLKKTKEVLDLIANDELFSQYDIRFVGGTALSYHINHRLSEDLDFASLILIPNEIEKMMSKYGATKIQHNTTMQDYAINDGDNINNAHMIFNLHEVKIEFFTPPFNLLEEEIWKEDNFQYYENTYLKIAALETIIYMKTLAFWNRKKYRDMYDVYYILENKYCSPADFVEKYLKYNITYTIENLYEKIQATSQFYEKADDEGINALVKEPKPYEWYRAKIEEYIHKLLIDKIYKQKKL